MSARKDGWLVATAKRLGRLRRVPSRVLAEIVARDGACLEISTDDGPPRWLHEDGTDRELAARLCRGCPVQLECLELELRMFGEQTVGVWGALGEDDRRALVTHWRPATARSAASPRPRPQPPRSDRGGER
jgi:WhiB family transcriptional regulator, redox-sensing transcriptional regulator